MPINQDPLDRMDAALLHYTDFEPSFQQWLSNLVDTINQDLDQLDSFIESFITGTVTLAAGTATVNTTEIAAGDLIFLNMTSQSSPGFTSTSIIPGVSFTITSSNGADASSYNWMIVKN